MLGVHLISEAERLAYADRDKYVADTDFVPLPGGSPDTLLGNDYLAGRAAMISELRTMGTAKPCDFGPPTMPAPPTPEHGTSQISIVDAQGNAAAMTTTVESAFGSFHMVDGFILNNQLTDFAAELNRDGDRLHFTFFVSGSNFIADGRRSIYEGPHQRRGYSRISFGGSPEQVRRRV